MYRFCSIGLHSWEKLEYENMSADWFKCRRCSLFKGEEYEIGGGVCVEKFTFENLPKGVKRRLFPPNSVANRKAAIAAARKKRSIP